MAVPKNTTGPKIHWLAYFWPGLPQLWMRGSWAGLAVAVGFTALANVLLLATLVFREWLPSRTMLVGYGALAVVWLAARWLSRAERRASLLRVDDDEVADELTEQAPAERDLMFREAQGHYLANDWVATEQVLLKLLKQDARDVESRLMLATLWRHQGRSSEALRQLDRLGRLEAADQWQHEIAAERVAIEELINEAQDDNQAEDDNNHYENQSGEARVELTEEIIENTDRDGEDSDLNDLGGGQRRAA